MSQIEVKNVSKSNIKRDRFVRITERRVNKILEDLNNLGKCSNKINYDYSDNDIKKIFREIARKVREVKLQFQEKSESRQRFRLM